MNFRNKMQSIQLVQAVQDVCRALGRVKMSVGQAMGQKVESSALMSTEDITLQAIECGQTQLLVSDELQAIESLCSTQSPNNWSYAARQQWVDTQSCVSVGNEHCA